MQLENVEDVYPLTSVQQGMLFHAISEPGSGVFVEQISFVVAGNLDVTTFRTVWEEIVARHAALRTTFLWDGLDEPLQVVRKSVQIPWTEMDWTHQSCDQTEARFAEFLRSDRVQEFDLAVPPLMRMTLIREAQRRTRFVWTFHHLLTDGWSTSLILKELFAAFAAKVSNQRFHPEKTFRFGDFLAHLHQRDDKAAERFWKEQLAGFVTPTRLPMRSMAATDPSTTTHERKRVACSDELSQKLREFSRQTRVTLNTLILGGWSLLLSRYCREDDIVFGTTVSGRPPELPGAENGVGVFINTLPIRVRCEETDLRSWLQGIQKQQVVARQFENTPLASIQRWSDIPRGEALFESIVVFENYPASEDIDLSRWGISIEELDYREQSNYPIALLVVPSQSIEIILVFDTSRFSDEFTSALMDGFRVLLESFVEHSDKPLQRHQLLADSARIQTIAKLDRRDSLAETHQTLHESFEATVAQRPHSVAVVFGNQRVTYRDLDRRSNQLAATLIAKGVRPGSHVGIYANRSVEMVVAIFGVLKAGCGYVPLDPDYPSSRTQFIVDDAQIAAIVIQTELPDSISSQVCVITVDEAIEPNSEFRSPAIRPNQTAYVIYTSGSQGQPKGVAISHRNIVSSTLARRSFYRETVNRFLLLSSFSFDSSMVGIFWTLLDGGTLVLPAQGLEQDMHALAEIVNDERVTHTLCLPTLYRLLLGSVDAHLLRSLSTVIVAGEVCLPSLVRAHRNALENAKLYNEYGPTEATVWCTACELTSLDSESVIDSHDVPIGRPIPGSCLYVVDQHLNLVPPGVVGELCVCGTGVAAGYLGQPGLTNNRFVANPFSESVDSRMYRTGDLVYQCSQGMLYFAGRVDQQVKIRGYRVELSEIENAIGLIPEVKEAAVITRSFETKSPDDLNTDLTDALTRIGPSQANQLLRELQSLTESEVRRQLTEGSR